MMILIASVRTHTRTYNIRPSNNKKEYEESRAHSRETCSISHTTNTWNPFSFPVFSSSSNANINWY